MTGKIIGIGLSRTTMTSLHAALVLLGCPAAHAFIHRSWLKGDFDPDVLSEYDAVTDLPMPTYYPDLDYRYPGSKFILTLRDEEAWLASMQAHFERQASKRNPPLDTIHAITYRVFFFNRDRFARVWEAHIRSVRYYFRDRPGDLLEMNISRADGWTELSGFLDKPVPAMPFPRLSQSLGQLEKVRRSEWPQKVSQLRQLLKDAVT